jgi:hypothetical protein
MFCGSCIIILWTFGILIFCCRHTFLCVRMKLFSVLLIMSVWKRKGDTRFYDMSLEIYFGKYLTTSMTLQIQKYWHMYCVFSERALYFERKQKLVVHSKHWFWIRFSSFCFSNLLRALLFCRYVNRYDSIFMSYTHTNMKSVKKFVYRIYHHTYCTSWNISRSINCFKTEIASHFPVKQLSSMYVPDTHALIPLWTSLY